MNWDAAYDRTPPAVDGGWHDFTPLCGQAAASAGGRIWRHRREMTQPRAILARLRHLGWLLAGAAAVAGAGDAFADASDANACATPFAAPRQTLILTRMLRRELGAGQEVISRRSYRIHIIPEGAGFRIDGELSGIEVSVPPNLEPIAQLERNRRDVGLFPILLDRQGIITSQPDPARQTLPVTARGLARGIVSGAGLRPEERTEALRFVDALLNAQGGVITQWPTDLFRPTAAQHSSTTHFPVANGQTGQVTVTLNAASDGVCGLVRSFERTVVTDLGGLQRVSHERWTLVAAQS